MAGYIDLLRDFIESPEQAVPAVRERPPFGLGVLCFLISGLSLFLAHSLSRRFLLLPPGAVSLVLICLWRVALGILLAGFLHLLAELSGGRGSAAGLFVFLGLGDLAWALALPAVLLLRLTGVGQFWFAVWAMLTAIGFLSLSLKAWGIRENYGLGLGKAWVLVCVPYVVSILLTMAAVSLAVAGAVVSVLRLFA